MEQQVICEVTPSVTGSIEKTLRQWMLPLAALALAVALAFLGSNFMLFQVTMVMIYTIAILGLNILTGFSGQVSLGHSAFFALGAYIAAISIGQWGVSYVLTPAIAGLVCLALGYVIGFPASRLDGTYLAVASFGLAIAMPKLLSLSVLQPYTGGFQGIIVDAPTAPSFLPITDGQWLYLFVLAWLVVFFALAYNLRDSRSGRAMLAIRENPIAATAMGIDTVKLKATAFALSAFYTGAAGALAALTVTFVAPESYTLIFSIALLVGLVIGGTGSIAGTLFGGAFILYVPNFADEISKSLAGAVYAAILLGLVFLMPEGAAGGVRRLAALISKKNEGRKE